MRTEKCSFCLNACSHWFEVLRSRLVSLSLWRSGARKLENQFKQNLSCLWSRTQRLANPTCALRTFSKMHFREDKLCNPEQKIRMNKFPTFSFKSKRLRARLYEAKSSTRSRTSAFPSELWNYMYYEFGLITESTFYSARKSIASIFSLSHNTFIAALF